MTVLEPRPRRGRRRRAVVVLVLAALAAALAGAAAAALLLRDDPPADIATGPPDRPPGLADYWAGRAALVLDKQWSSASLGRPDGGAYAGAHVEVVDGTWYLFHRRRYAEPCDGHGPESRRMGTEVRASTDRGATWGPPATVVAPTPGTPWACAATDGDAIYDEDAGKWRYLFQCQSVGAWHGCVVERRGESPVGRFSAPKRDPNPVITPGQLWGAICDDAGDDCARTPGQGAIGDEGTFNVFRTEEDDGWWVGFHGYDGSRAYRGLARTTSFQRRDWKVDGAGGTPDDAVLDADDATGWRENWAGGGPVGAGAASILEDDGSFYQLAEVPDMSLGCTRGQNWNLGLFRSPDLASTRWEQYPGGNPIVYSSKAPDATGQQIYCNVEYPGLFKDDATGTTYLMHGRIAVEPEKDGIYVYRLEWDRNRLVNGDFWRADAHGWEPREGAPAQLDVRRFPDESPDGTPYLALNCGATCDGGPSAFQDVPVDAQLAGARVAFGGTFRSNDASGGRLEVAVLQLDDAGGVIESTILDVQATDRYARGRGELEVDDRSRRLRFELYPRTPGTLRADNLYLIPQEGCQAPRYPAC